jgi:3-oxoacyl-[acyl-carrier protein] reductase
VNPRTCLVAGAAGGIGGAVTAVALARGFQVLATDLDEHALARRATSAAWAAGPLELQGLDVRDADAWDSAVDAAEAAFGPLDLVVNAAGVVAGHAGADTPLDAIDLQIGVNLQGAVLATRAAARVMRPRGAGHIVHVASMAGLMPQPGFALYSATKYAVRAFSLAVAAELEPEGVAVTVVCPATVDTPMFAAQRAYCVARGVPVPERPMAPEVVARAILAPRVLRRRPRELWVPRSLGAAARLIDLVPGPALRAVALLGRLR